MLYLSAADIVRINETFAAGVIDRGGVESVAGAVHASFAGTDAYEGVWCKAAAYLRGLVTTQHFVDANKRTAWITAVTFLRLNGVTVRHVPAVLAETLVRGIAAGIFVDESRNEDRTIAATAEWLEEACALDASSPLAPLYVDPRLEYISLALEADSSQLPIYSAAGVGIGGVAFPGIPGDRPAFVAYAMMMRVHWRPDDVRKEGQVVAVRFRMELIDVATGALVHVENGRAEYDPHQSSTRWHHPNGLMPHVYVLHLGAVFPYEGEFRLRVLVNGVEFANLPLDRHPHDDVPDFVPVALLDVED